MKNGTLKRLLIIALVALVAAVAYVAFAPSTGNEEDEKGGILSGKYYVQIDIQDYGTIVAELDADIAPITVTNFMKLVDEKYYDGLTFHRIMSGFMMQGGAGSPVDAIKGEFAQNGIKNDLKHTRGVLSMARTVVKDSASSQFFIMHQDAPHLDGLYAAFGQVLSGMEVVDAICENTPVQDSNGTVKAEDRPVITRIVRIEKPE
ncbi:MAG: peptidylprolyl isomerase [Clostridia bacterium]|nr:peptidylprolyl isomerase [Clostridia bacterium]